MSPRVTVALGAVRGVPAGDASPFRGGRNRCVLTVARPWRRTRPARTKIGFGGGVSYHLSRHIAQRDTARTRSSFTKAATKVGVNYQLRDSPASAHLEGTGSIYQWDRYGFDNTQLDMAVSGGISYRFEP